MEYLVTGEESHPDSLSVKPEIRDLIKDLKQLNKDDREMIHDIIQLFRNKQNKKGNSDTISNPSRKTITPDTVTNVTKNKA